MFGTLEFKEKIEASVEYERRSTVRVREKAYSTSYQLLTSLLVASYFHTLAFRNRSR